MLNRYTNNLGTFTEPATEHLYLANNTSEPLAFKVKTTAPKLYCVRPNASVVAPGESMKISLILQGFTQPLPKDYKCKDKFLIVSLPCPELDDPSKVGENWAQLEAKHKDQLLQKKLKVNFEIEDERDETRIDDISFANATQSAPIISNDDADVTKNFEDKGAAAPVEDTTLETSDLQKVLQSSNSKINALSEKLDSNEKNTEKTASTSVARAEPVNAVSFPFAILLVILALLVGYYVF